MPDVAGMSDRRVPEGEPWHWFPRCEPRRSDARLVTIVALFPPPSPATALEPLSPAILPHAEAKAALPAGVAAASPVGPARVKSRRVTLSPAMILAQALEPRGGGRASAPPVADPLHVLLRSSRRSRTAAQPSGFWQVWLAHRDYLQRFSLRFSGGNAADAEDALSEAMLKAATAFETALVHNQRAWLLRLVHNACMDRHRGHRRQHRIAEAAGHGEGCPFPIVRPPQEPSPEDLLSAAQSDSELVQAMGALPRALAEPLRLHLDDQPDAEIAARLNVSKEVVRKRRQLAKDFLRRRLAE